MKPLYVIGFMGAGKTTIGQALAAHWDMPVIDTDDAVEEAEGRSIPDIFSQDGEEAFRRMETAQLKRVTANNTIITTGGGIVLKQENREWMAQHGTVLYLHCEPEEVYRRLEDDSSRPLLNGDKKQQIASRLEERLPLYKEAHITIDTTNRTVPEIVEAITAKIV